MKYCRNCKQMVAPDKNISALALILLFLLFIIPGIVYLAYCVVKKATCPICNSKNWGTLDDQDKDSKRLD